MVAIEGWVSEAAARASRVSRSLRTGSRAYSAGQRLERDRAAEPRIFGLVDDAHAAAADFLDDPVRTDVGARERSPARCRRRASARPPMPVLRGTAGRRRVWTARSDLTSSASAASVAAVRSSRLWRAAPWSSSAAWNRSLICRQRSGVTLARLRLRPSRLRLARSHCLMFRRLTAENVTHDHEFSPVKTAGRLPRARARATPARRSSAASRWRGRCSSLPPSPRW